MSMILNKKLTKQSSEMIQHTDEFLVRAIRGRVLLERRWFTSILFDRGFQWLQGGQEGTNTKKAGSKKKLIRPVTNKYKAIKNSLISVITSFDPRMTYAPQTDSPDDQHTAQTATHVIKALEAEWEWERKKMIALPWLVLTGGVFFIPGFDRNQGSIQIKNEAECVGRDMNECSYVTNDTANTDTCPECAKKGIRSPMRMRMESDGVTPKEVPVRSGKMTLDVATHFEMFLDPSIEDMHEQDTVVRVHRKTRSYVGKKYGLKQADIDQLETAGITTIGGEALRFRTAIANYMSATEMYYTDKVDVIEVWQKPTKQFPVGFHMVRIGSKVLHLDVYPYITHEGRIFSSIVYIPYEREPGCFYGSTPMYACLELQRTRNRLEGLVIMAAFRMGSPIWIMPEPGTRMQLTGDAGLVLKYQPTANSNARPIRDEGVPIPISMVQMIRDVDTAMFDVVGLGEVDRGQRPLSVRTHSAIEKLSEVSRSRQSGLFNSYTMGLADLQTVGVEMYRMIQPTDRYSRVSGGSTGKWTIKKIEQADLMGGVDVAPEVGGTLPKTTIERQALVTTLMTSGMIDIQNPKTVQAVYRLFGITELLPDMDSDMMQIVREHDKFRDGEPLQRNEWDNDQMHSDEHRQFMLTEEFEDMDQQQQAALLQHKQEHDMVLAQQQQQLQQQQQQQLAIQAQLKQRKVA